MDSFVRDLRYAVRQLARAPLFTATAIAIVALGIGANTAAFSVVNAMLFRPQPFERGDRIVDIYQDSDDGEPNSSSFPAYRDMAAYDDLLEGVAAIYNATVNLQREEGTALALVEFTTANYFDVLGLRPAIGRWFDTEEDGSGGAPVAVLSHRTWRTEFGGSPDVLGSVIRLNGAPVTVVGVGPEGYGGTFPLTVVDAWLSLSSLGTVQGSWAAATLEQRGDHWFFVKARMRDGVEPAQVQEAMNGLAARLAREFPEHNEGRDITVFAAGDVRLHPSIDGVLSPAALALMAVVGLVLLTACSNLANLLLARATAREREMSIRVAVGANRGQVARQLLTESVLLSLVGGIAGWLLAGWSLNAIMALQPPLPVPVSIDIGLDGRVLLFTLALTLITGVAFGLAPAVRSSRPDLASAMRDERAVARRQHRRFGLRNGLVVLQVAASFVLLVAAGLFVRSLGNVQRVDTGFAVEDVAFVQIDPTHAGYNAEDARAVAERLIERVRGGSVAAAAGLATAIPVTQRGTTTLVIDGYEPPSGTGSVEVPFSIVDEGYFEALRIPLLHGRTFTSADNPDSEPVAIVSEAMARRYWGAADAVGRRFRSQGSADSWTRVVGVVADTKVRELTEDPTPQFYRPWSRGGSSRAVLFARADGSAAGLIGYLREELRAIDDTIPMLQAKTMPEHLGDSLYLPRMALRFLGGLGLLALALASLGLYGIVSFTVGRRTLEVGVRMALGARTGQVVWMVLRDVLVLAGVGIVVGAGLALAATAGLRGFLFDVSPADPTTLVAVALVLMAVALAAALIPARRASRADAVVALRHG